jgi:type I restriction enzyme, S subunit
MEVEERVEQEALFEPPLETSKVEDLPEHWVLSPLSATLRIVKARERAISIEDEKTYRLLTVKLYAKGITLRSIVNGSQIGVSTLYKTHPEDFIVSKIDARNGAWGFVPDHLAGGLVSGDFPIFRLNEGVADADFLSFILSQPRAWEPLKEQAIGSTGRRRVQASDFLEIEIPLPPLPEQKAIAAALRAVRDSREATARALEEAKAFKRSLMRHVFTFGPVSLEEAGNVELQETEIGEIPKDWEFKTLESIAKIGNGSTPKRDMATYWDGGSFPWMTSGKVHEGRISYADQFVTETALKECHLPMVPAGSVLVAITGQGKTLGTAAITEIDTTVNQHIAYAKFENAKEWNEFVYHYLKFKYEDLRAVAGSGGSTKAALTCGFLKTYKIPAPNLEQREQINESFNAADTFYESLESRLSSLDALFQSLLYHLMTGRVRVPSTTTGDA